MSCAKRLRKMFAMMMVMVMMLSVMGVSANAASSVEDTAQELYYITYNEKNEVVEEGVIPVNENGKYSWKGSITLGNGWYTAFLKPGPKPFYATSGTEMTFSYKLDRSAKIEYYFYQGSTQDTLYPNTWKSGTKTSSGTSISKTTNKDGYYFVGVTNVSSDDITISNVSFVF